MNDVYEMKTLLKNNLKLEWQMDKDYNHYLALTIDGETISRVKFATD